MDPLTALTITFCWAATAETAFALFYGFAFPWRRTELGRQMLVYSVIVAAIMSLALLSRWGQPGWSPWLFVGGYSSFALAVTWRLIILWRLWRDGHEETRKLPSR